MFLAGILIISAVPCFSTVLKVAGGPADKVAFSLDGKFVAGASRVGDITVWRIEDWKEIPVYRTAAEASGVSLSFSRDNNFLAAGLGNQVRIYNTEDWQELRRITLDGQVGDMAFSPYGDYLLTADPQWMRIYSVPDLKELKRIKHPRPVINIAFSANGRYIAASARNDDDVHIWEIPSFEEVAAISLGEHILSISISPYTDLLALAGRRSVKIFELDSWREIKTIKQETPAYSLSFNSEGEYLAVGEDAGFTVYNTKGWDVHNQKHICCPVTDLEFSIARDDLGVVGSDLSPDEITVFNTSMLNITHSSLPNLEFEWAGSEMEPKIKEETILKFLAYNDGSLPAGQVVLNFQTYSPGLDVLTKSAILENVYPGQKIPFEVKVNSSLPNVRDLIVEAVCSTRWTFNKTFHVKFKAPLPARTGPIEGSVSKVLGPTMIQIDKGKKDGLKPGNTGTIYDTITTLDGKSEKNAIVEIVVLSVTDDSAFCKIAGEAYLPVLTEDRVLFPEP